tara:strand:+ start:155 stop:433 length:279 start_codon:yes stop_codon:yes gene_type:complete
MEKIMIQGMIAKKVLELVIKKIEKRFDLGSILKYVKEPNELDIAYKQSQKTISKQGKYIEQLEVKVAHLEKHSHPPIKNIEKRLKYLERKLK